MGNWITLKTKPLFFVPAALPIYNQYNFNISQLVDIAKDIYADRSDAGIGRSSIENVLKLKPVKHKTSERFVKVLNEAVHRRGGSEQIPNNVIISAVFRLQLANEMADSLGFTNAGLSVMSNLSETLVDNVRRGGRVHLTAALAIRDALSKRAEEKGHDKNDQVGALLMGDIERFVLHDRSQAMAIHTDDLGECCIKESDLSVAPEDGHPFTIAEENTVLR